MTINQAIVIANRLSAQAEHEALLTLRVTLLQRGSHRRTGLAPSHRYRYQLRHRLAFLRRPRWRSCINADHRFGLTAGPSQLHQTGLTAKVYQPSVPQQALLAISSVVSLF